MPPCLPISDATVTYQPEVETVSLEFPSELPVGVATLVLQYTGILNDQMKGFYRSKYTHPDHPGEERYSAVTQFEVQWAISRTPHHTCTCIEHICKGSKWNKVSRGRGRVVGLP